MPVLNNSQWKKLTAKLTPYIAHICAIAIMMIMCIGSTSSVQCSCSVVETLGTARYLDQRIKGSFTFWGTVFLHVCSWDHALNFNVRKYGDILINNVNEVLPCQEYTLQTLVATSQRYYQPVLIPKVGCKGNNGKNGYSIQGLVSSRSEGYSSKWPIWLVCREPLYNPLKRTIHTYIHTLLS